MRGKRNRDELDRDFNGRKGEDMAKKQNKTKTISSADLGQAQRVGIFGASGCGKTTKARALIRNLNRIVFFEPLADDLRRLQEQDGFKVVVGLPELFRQIRARFNKGFKLGYYPSAGEEEKELADLSNFLMTIQSGFGFQHSAHITLVVDELDLSFPTGASLRNPKNGFKNLCCRGRHTGVHILGLSQRMHLIDNVFRANCSAVYLFRHSEPADIDVGLKIIGREYKETFRNLDNFQYVYKQGNKIFVKA